MQVYPGYDEDFNDHDPKGPFIVIGALVVLAAIIIWGINNIHFN